MKPQQHTYYVWAKGCQGRDGAVSAAWKIVYNGEGQTGSEIPKLAEGDTKRGADIAELVAVQRALQNIPRKKDVVLRVSASNVHFMLGIGQGPREDAPAGLKSAFSAAMKAIDAQSSFQINQTTGSRDDHMKEVGKIAETALTNISRNAPHKDI